MATGKLTFDEGTTTNVATNTITEDAVTKHINRTVLNTSSGTEIDTNSGNKSAGTIRVVLATDQPALSNKLLVTPDLPSGASTAANQATEIASLASIDGKITAVNTGAVVISSGSVTADTELPAAGALGDSVSNPTTPMVGGAQMTFNGTTWERARSNIGDGASSTGLPITGPMLYNGTTYDRARGDSTNGMYVNIKANTAATPAGTNLIGKVSASCETSTIYDGTTALTPKFATIAASSSGNNTIVAAVTSKKIRVLAVQVNASAAVNFKWQSGASGTDLTGLNYAAANGGYVLPFNPAGWFETASNTLLNLNLSAANAVGGSLTYIEV